LGAFVDGHPAEETAAGPGPTGNEIVKLLPELGALLPDLAPMPMLSPEQQKRRLFHALTRFVCGLAETQPVLAVFEDLHWSDEATLEFLLHLGRRIESRRILLLITCRNDEPHPSLSHFLAELDRQRLAAELILGPLSQADVDVMVRAIFNLQRPVRPAFLEAIYQLTEGNPFFVEEVLKSLVAAGGESGIPGAWDHRAIEHLAIPRTVADAVRRRMTRLSPEAEELLVLAAVLGQRFDFTVLRQVTQTDDAQLVQRLKELMAAQLVIEESGERIAFRHALTREAIYSQLLTRERQNLHRAIAEAMERSYGNSLDVHLEALAYHSYEAEVWEKALVYCQRAGDKAQALFAPRAAVEHFSRALEAASRLDIFPTPRLWRVRGLAYETLGEFESALADQERALEGARLAGDSQEEAQSLLHLGLLWASRDYARAGEHYQEAVKLAATRGDQPLLARSLNRVGNWRLNIEQPNEALRCHQEALQILERIGDEASVAETLDLMGMASLLAGDTVASRTSYQRAIALFERVDDRQGLVSSLVTMAVCGGVSHTDTMVPAIALPEAIALAERALDLARDIGWRSGESYALWNLALCLGARGRVRTRAGLRRARLRDRRRYRSSPVDERCQPVPRYPTPGSDRASRGPPAL